MKTKSAQSARTGLKLEKRLYLKAQAHADSLGMSFAAYVIDLIARDLANLEDARDIPDVRRILGIQSDVCSEGHTRRKSEREMAHQHYVSEHPPGSEMRDLRCVGKADSRGDAQESEGKLAAVIPFPR